MPRLVLRHESSGRRWQVWPDAEIPAAGEVRETEQYLFELSDHPQANEVDLLIDDAVLEPLRSATADTARWRWSPGFHAGRIEAALRIPGAGLRQFEIVTDPDVRKLSRADFDTMVREILQDTWSLFSLSPFRVGIAKGEQKQVPPIARLEFIRSRIDELERIIADIDRRPRRYLAAEDVVVPYHRATRATSVEILRSFRSGDIRFERSQPSRLPANLRGCLPANMRLRQRQSSLDIPEHRQMAACLRSWASWLSAAGDRLELSLPATDAAERTQTAAWVNRCRRLSRRISVMTDVEFLRDVGTAQSTLTLTSIFRHDPAYQRFFQLWRDMNAGLAAVFGSFLNMPIARTYELYELWCFLRLLTAAVRRWGDGSVDVSNLFVTGAAGSVTIANGAVTVNVGEDWALNFQNPIREYWLTDDRRGSFSRTMTPDMVMGRRGDTARKRSRLIVLDAKYRVEQGLNDAISSIHMYRDAIVQELPSQKVRGAITAAYLVTPYVPDLVEDFRETRMPSRLFHPAYRKAFRFGAVALRPGMTAAEIDEVLVSIVTDAGLSV